MLPSSLLTTQNLSFCGRVGAVSNVCRCTAFIVNVPYCVMCITWMHDASITLCFDWPYCGGPDRSSLSWRLHNEGITSLSSHLPQATTGLLIYLWRGRNLPALPACLTFWKNVCFTESEGDH